MGCVRKRGKSWNAQVRIAGWRSFTKSFKSKSDAVAIRNGKLKPTDLSEEKRDYYLERRYPAFGNLVPRDVASKIWFRG